MKLLSTRLLWVALIAVALTGCAGRDFSRPEGDSTKLGATTYDQVVSKYGSPRQTSAVTSNGNDVKVITYSHAEAAPFTTILRVKSMSFGFDKASLLVTYDFVSSFDDTKRAPITTEQVKMIKAGLTRTDLIAAMGQPNGEAIFPMVDEGSTLLRYNFLETWRIPFVPAPRINKKTMRVTLDQNSIVTDVKVEESNQN